MMLLWLSGLFYLGLLWSWLPCRILVDTLISLSQSNFNPRLLYGCWDDLPGLLSRYRCKNGAVIPVLLLFVVVRYTSLVDRVPFGHPDQKSTGEYIYSQNAPASCMLHFGMIIEPGGSSVVRCTGRVVQTRWNV